MYYIVTNGKGVEVYDICGVFTTIDDLRKYIAYQRTTYDGSPHDSKYTITQHINDDDYDEEDENNQYFDTKGFDNIWVFNKTCDYILDKIIEKMFPNWHTDVVKLLERKLPNDIVSVLKKYIE